MTTAERPIVLVTELFPPDVGGSANLLANAYAKLSSISVDVITSAPAAPGGLGQMRVHHSPLARPQTWSPLRPAGARYYVAKAREILKLSQEGDPVVHVGRALPEGLAAAAARWIGGPPFLVWVHGEELSYYRTSRELRILAHFVFARAAGVLVNSRNTAAELASFGVTPKRVGVAHPAVDADVFSPAVDPSTVRARLVPGKDLMILSVGRLQKRKGHDLTLQALARLPARVPPWRYVIVGDGDERQTLMHLAHHVGIADRVTFVGAVAQDELPGFFAACDLFVLPNRVEGGDFEGFGIVFLEAAATGKAAIGGRSGGVIEAVEDGQTGLLVSGTDVAELAEALTRLLSDPELRGALGEQGRQRVVQHFTWQRTAEAILMCHRSIQAARSAGIEP